MKVHIQLDANDIAKIIANHFGVQEDKVTVETESKTEGYGMAEHTVHVAVASVDAKIVPIDEPKTAAPQKANGRTIKKK